MNFRALEPQEIECRVGQISKNGSGLSLLLYKTARADADILDETLGSENWQCEFYECKGTLFCKVGILIDRKDGYQEWTYKDDAGSPSNMEAAKGEASDAFKRACFKWGIGRELYTAPFIWIRSDACTITQGNNGKFVCFDRFAVSDCAIVDHKIVYLEIVNEKTGAVVYHWGTPHQSRIQANEPTMEQLSELSGLVRQLAEMRGVETDVVIKALNESKAVVGSGVVNGEIKTARQAVTAIGQLRSWIERGQSE